MPWFIAKVKWKNWSEICLEDLDRCLTIFPLERVLQLIQPCPYDGMFLVLETSSSQEETSRDLVSIKPLTSFENESILIDCLRGRPLLLVDTALDKLPNIDIVRRIRRHISQPRHEVDLRKEQTSNHFFSLAQMSFEMPVTQVEWYPSDKECQISFRDEQLARRWFPENILNEDAVTAQMFSARIAEKVVAKFYKNLGHKVTDVSISQLEKGSTDWKLYDLLIDGKLSVDVKNARTPVASKRFYVDLCVPRFKSDRNNSEVNIAGVFSPYLRLRQLQGGDVIPEGTNPIYFLGQTSLSIIKQLEKEYSTENININIGWNTNHSPYKGVILPPWVFDYPVRFYEKQELSRETIRQTNAETIPPKANWPHNINLLPVSIASGRDIPSEWLPQNVNRPFLDKLSALCVKKRIGLPELYLMILTDFLLNISQTNTHGFLPSDYRQYIYISEKPVTPLGILDPLSIIDSLISNLGLLWENRENIFWNDIVEFKIRGLGIVQALTKENQTITLIAYCGGKISLKGKCGHSPLIFGVQKTCKICHKLICDECNYCSDLCMSLERGDEESIGFIESELQDDVIF